MLVTSGEIDSKLYSRACSRGGGFISVSDALLVISYFSNMEFFSNCLNKKSMSGGSKITKKKRLVTVFVCLSSAS